MLQSHAVRSTPEPVGAVPFPEAGTKLKSERVQLDFQLLPVAGGALQTLAGGGAVTLQAVTVSLAFDAAAAGPAAGSVEAGLAFGAPGSIDQPSTEGKEADHAHTALAR